MGQVESEAIVLRTYDLAEADKIAVCLTREAGLVRAVARGARRLKSRFGGGLEPFTLVHLSYYEKEGRELVTLSQLEIVRSYFKLSSSVECVSALAYMSELVLAFAPPHEPNEKMYRMIRACLEAIESVPEELGLTLRYFEVWMLRLTGFFSLMGNCARCGRRFPEGSAMRLDTELRQLCEDCGKGLGTKVSAGARDGLKRMQRQSPQEFVSAAGVTGSAAEQELEQLLRRVIRYVLEREPGRALVLK
ncbi:MAG TPA: DNA repair protein RecO [Pyrinomonadaceae bacterium]